MPTIIKYRVQTENGHREFRTLEQAEQFANGQEVEEIEEECATDPNFLPRPAPVED